MVVGTTNDTHDTGQIATTTTKAATTTTKAATTSTKAATTIKAATTFEGRGRIFNERMF